MPVIVGLVNQGNALALAYERVVVNGPSARSAASALVQEYDADGDGTLAPGELTVSDSSFRTLDFSGDGRVDAGEIERMFSVESRLSTQSAMVQQIFAHRDLDGDGSLSPAELIDPVLGFQRIDVDRDGGVSPAEMRRQLKKFADEDDTRGPSIRGGSGNLNAATLQGASQRPGAKIAYLHDAFGTTELARAAQRHRVGLEAKGAADPTSDEPGGKTTRRV